MKNIEAKGIKFCFVYVKGGSRATLRPLARMATVNICSRYLKSNRPYCLYIVLKIALNSFSTACISLRAQTALRGVVALRYQQ